MTESKGAPPPERKKWDKSEWEAKAKEKDKMYAERAKEAEAAMKEGRKPRYADENDKTRTPREMEDRNTLDLNRNVGKTQIVQTSTGGKGPRGPGFYCEVCNRTLKDSISYLDHLNSGYHLRQLGQTTRTTRSTLGQVRARIAQLREETKHKTTAANFDFKERLSKVKDAERAEKEARKEDRKRKREERRKAEAGEPEEEDVQMEQMMGFGGFGGAKRR